MKSKSEGLAQCLTHGKHSVHAVIFIIGLYCFQFFILMKLCFALCKYNFLAFRTCIPNQIPSFGPWRSLLPWLSALGFIRILWMWRENHSIVPHLKDLRATKQSFLSFLLTSVCMPCCRSSKPPPRPWTPQPLLCEHHFQQMVTYPNLSGISDYVLWACSMSLLHLLSQEEWPLIFQAFENASSCPFGKFLFPSFALFSFPSSLGSTTWSSPDHAMCSLLLLYLCTNYSAY